MLTIILLRSPMLLPVILLVISLWEEDRYKQLEFMPPHSGKSPLQVWFLQLIFLMLDGQEIIITSPEPLMKQVLVQENFSLCQLFQVELIFSHLMMLVQKKYLNLLQMIG